MGRDTNNQMYPITWAVVKLENGLTDISDSHKDLLNAVSDWLPNAEHRKCTRHVFVNFKKKFSGVQLQRLFWHAASTTLEQKFYSKMTEMKVVSQEAYEYLIKRNPNSWCRAFFRFWMVTPSGFQELEVRKGHEAYGVNIHLRTYPVEGVDHWYSQHRWCEAYQFSIRHVFGSIMWKRTENPPLLPQIIRTMPGRPRKNRVKA
ncbi:hypothetical protein Tco_1159622 [Tanacetum coccineum]